VLENYAFNNTSIIPNHTAINTIFCTMKKKCVPVTTCVLLGPEPVFSDHAGDLLPPFPCLGLELATLTHLGEAVSLLRVGWAAGRVREPQDQLRGGRGCEEAQAGLQAAGMQQSGPQLCERESPEHAGAMPNRKAARVRVGSHR